jgi:hypothetical protein
MIKVLFTSLNADFGQDGVLKYDDAGNPTNESWEKGSVFPAWQKLADEGLVDLQTHWVDQQSDPKGLERLVSLAKDADFVFQIPVTHALGIHLPQSRQIIEGGTPIVSYHPDAHLRYRWPGGDRFVLSRMVEGYDTHLITPAQHTLQQFEDDGWKAYVMPFGVPEFCDRDPEAPKLYDVSFVGQKHGIRQKVINDLREIGVQVHTFGHFWNKHPLHHEERPTYTQMAEIFNQTKVNLNLRWCSRDASFGQLKGRDFELMGCGAFMAATQHVECDDMHSMAQPGVDFCEEHYVTKLVSRIKHYVDAVDEREKMADSFYQKREANLWTTRFRQFLDSKFWEK